MARTAKGAVETGLQTFMRMYKVEDEAAATLAMNVCNRMQRAWLGWMDDEPRTTRWGAEALELVNEMQVGNERA